MRANLCNIEQANCESMRSWHCISVCVGRKDLSGEIHRQATSRDPEKGSCVREIVSRQVVSLPKRWLCLVALWLPRMTYSPQKAS